MRSSWNHVLLDGTKNERSADVELIQYRRTAYDKRVDHPVTLAIEAAKTGGVAE
jgi:hypothetical protein